MVFESWPHLMDFMIRGLSSNPSSIRVDPQIYNCCQRSWGARRAGLDAGASAAYLASPPSRKTAAAGRRPGSGLERRPPARPPGQGKPSASRSPHTARQSKSHRTTIRFGWQGSGAPSPRVDARPRPAPEGTRVRLQEREHPRNPLMRWMGGARNQWPGQSAAAPVLRLAPGGHGGEARRSVGFERVAEPMEG